MSQRSKERRQAARAQRTTAVPPDPTTAPVPARQVPYSGLPGHWAWHVLACAALAGLVVLLYWGDLRLGFFSLDDPDYVTRNPLIRGWSGENLRHILTEPYFANYSPLHILSYLADHSIAGMNPLAFHLSSNLWAGLGAGLVYLLGTMLSGRRLIGLGAGLLFAVHPVHVEAVAWISSRKDLVAAVFALLSVLAWLLCRRAGRGKAGWYAASLVCFVLALAGKLSVAVLPGILAAFDLFIEKRRLWPLLLDKIPFALAVLGFALGVMQAQPETGHGLDPFVLAATYFQNLWLLSGLADYVIYRVRPSAPSVLAHALVVIPAVALVLPLWLRRWVPGWVLALLCWVQFAFVPPQVLGFVHPVADRYLYFPSVGWAILVSWAIVALAARLDRRGPFVATGSVVLLAAAWATATLGYLREWQDPRSVWYAATAKSPDVYNRLYLGTTYHDAAQSVTAKPGPDTQDRLHRLATVLWPGDARLEALRSEWDAGRFTGPASTAFVAHLRQLAWEQFEAAAKVPDRPVLPNLFFRRGVLQTNLGNLDEARSEFEAAIAEATRHTYSAYREEMLVRSQHALAVIAWRKREYPEAMRLLGAAREAQRAAGKTWIPDLDAQIQKLTRLMGRTG